MSVFIVIKVFNY